jgi:malate permease and related proteins
MAGYFSPVLFTVLQLLTMMAVGFFIKKSGRLPNSFFPSLSVFLVDIALPFYFFTKLASSNRAFLHSSWIFPLAAVAYTSLGLFLGFLIFRFSSFTSTEKHAGIVLSGFGNFAILPLTLMELFPQTVPVIAELFDTDASVLYIGTMAMIMTPLLWSIGYALISGSTKNLSLSRILNPPVIGIIFGLIALFSPIGAFLNSSESGFVYHVFSGIRRIGSITFPLILISIGAMIADIETRVEGRDRLIKMALGVVLVRFLLFPALFFFAYFALLRHISILTPSHLWVLFLEAHIPPANNVATMARRVGSNESYIAFTTLITYTLYLVLLPLYLSFFLSLLT